MTEGLQGCHGPPQLIRVQMLIMGSCWRMQVSTATQNGELVCCCHSSVVGFLQEPVVLSQDGLGGSL